TTVVSNASPGGDVDLYYFSAALINKATLGDTSPVSPSIASLGGRLYIAWKGNGNNNLNVMYSSDNGSTFGNKHTSCETSPQPPALCAHNGNVYVAWKGDGNEHLNVSGVRQAGGAIVGLFGFGAHLFSYECEFSGIPSAGLSIRNVEELTWSVQTLEAYQVQ